MLLLLAITEKTLTFIIVFSICLGIIIGEFWRHIKKRDKYEAPKVINLDEYETFEIDPQEWREKKKTVSN